MNPITTEIANICEMITAVTTLIKDLMSNNDIKLIISNKLNASVNFPLCRYLFNNPVIKHRYINTNRIMEINAIIMLPFKFNFV